MSGFLEIARDNALPISNDLAESPAAPALASDEADHAGRLIPSFWNFVDDGQAPVFSEIGRSRTR